MRRALLAVSFVAACTPQTSRSRRETTTIAPAEPTRLNPTEPELLGVMQTAEGLTLQLRSGGCRDQADVRFAVVEDRLVIETLEADDCEAKLVLGEQVLFPWAELPASSELGLVPTAAPVLEPGTTPGPTSTPAGADEAWIYGVLVSADGLDIRVASSGCTSIENFTTRIELVENLELVHLLQTKLDRCEAYIPEGVLLHFTWAQLGVTKNEARLVNPIQKMLLN